MAITDRLASMMLDNLMRGGREVALYSNGTEVRGNNYTRAPITWGRTLRMAMNKTDVWFPVALPDGWGTLTGYAVLDSEGRSLMEGQLAKPRMIEAGDQFLFRAGELSCELAEQV